jgi:transcriptional regulator with XRE-family HTH domain
MEKPLQLRTPNVMLASVRQLAGYSQQELADRLTEVAGRQGDRHTVCDVRMVRRWESGEVVWPQGRYRALLENVFNKTVMELGFLRKWTRTPSGWTMIAGFPDAPSSFKLTGEAAFTADFQGFTFGIQARGHGGEHSHWLASEAALSTSGRGGRRIGADHVDQAQRLSEQLNSLDHAQGGGALLRQAINGVKATRLILQHGEYAESTGRRLENVVGEMLIQAGWLAYDSGLQALARHLYGEAMILSQMSGCTEIAAHAFSNMSIQANALGQPKDAVRLAEAAQRKTSSRATPRVASIFAMHAARGLASLGESAACHRALAVSMKAYEVGPSDHDPTWIGYLNEPELASLTGVCLMDLGQNRIAERHFEKSVQDLNHFARNRFSSATFCMRNLLASGEAEHACEVGETLLPEIFDFTSARVVNQLQGFCTDLRSRSDSPAGKNFLETVGARPGGRDVDD